MAPHYPPRSIAVAESERKEPRPAVAGPLLARIVECMEIVQATFAVFHQFELATQLHLRGHLQKIFSTWPWARLKREGLPRALVSTFPLIHTADYLLNRTRFYPAAFSSKRNRWNALGFDRWTNARIGPTDAFIAISGAGLLTGRTVQQRDGKF